MARRLLRRQQRAVVILRLALEPLETQLQHLTYLVQSQLMAPPVLHPEIRELLLEVLNSLQPPAEQVMRQGLGLPTEPR